MDELINLTNENTLKDQKILSNENIENNTTFNTINKNTLKKRINIILLILSIFSYLFYVKSLEGCYLTQAQCLVTLSPGFFKNLVVLLLSSSFVYSLVFITTFFFKISSIYIFLLNSFVYLLLFIYDKGNDLAYHGYYNKIIFIISTVLWIIVILNFYLIFYIILYKKRKYKLIAFFFFVLIALESILNLKLKDACKYWDKGLNNESINNEGIYSNCVIKKPLYCWQNVFDNLFDVSYIIKEDCNQFRKGEKEEFLKLIDSKYKNYNKFAYPNISNWPWIPTSYYNRFQKYIFKNMIVYDDNNNEVLKNNELNKEYFDLNSLDKNISEFKIKKLKPEIFLSFDKENNLGKIQINIDKNDDLIEKRKLKYNKNKNILNSYYKTSNIDKTIVEGNDVMIIYIDAISRVHYLRKMKKVTEFINFFYNKKSLSHEAFQFFKYIQFRAATQFNINPMFYGQSQSSYKGTGYTYNLHEMGYITGKVLNMCSRELYDLEKDELDPNKTIENINFNTYDYDGTQLFCDPNYTSPDHPYSPYIGPYSVKKRCLYGKDTFQYAIDYAEKFWKAYSPNEKDIKKFFALHFIDAHEGTNEVAKYLDTYLSKFLWDMYYDNRFYKTSLIFVSDHGNQMIGLYQAFNCNDFDIEKVLGALFVVLPNENDYSYDDNKLIIENLKYNQNALISPYDIYSTILEIVGFRQYEEVYKSNNCTSSSEHIMDKSICKEIETIDNVNYEYSNLSSSLFDKINSNRDCYTYSKDLPSYFCRCSNNYN